MGQSKMIMKNLTVEMKAVGSALTKQGKASDATNDHRFALALALHEAGIDLNNKVVSDEIKLDLSKAYPKGVGKKETLDPAQAKAVSAVRQVLCTFKKGCEMHVTPSAYESYSEYRGEVYGDQKPATKLETIQKWIDTDKVSTQELQALLNEYKAILDLAA
jgi:hypothetical protein|tara:strand:- start:1617 stop:2099 length:483 start_codon:yes stop_codon:yes gene_type:complete